MKRSVGKRSPRKLVPVPCVSCAHAPQHMLRDDDDEAPSCGPEVQTAHGQAQALRRHRTCVRSHGFPCASSSQHKLRRPPGKPQQRYGTAMARQDVRVPSTARSVLCGVTLCTSITQMQDKVWSMQDQLYLLLYCGHTPQQTLEQCDAQLPRTTFRGVCLVMMRCFS